MLSTERFSVMLRSTIDIIAVDDRVVVVLGSASSSGRCTDHWNWPWRGLQTGTPHGMPYAETGLGGSQHRSSAAGFVAPRGVAMPSLDDAAIAVTVLGQKTRLLLLVQKR